VEGRRKDFTPPKKGKRSVFVVGVTRGKDQMRFFLLVRFLEREKLGGVTWRTRRGKVWGGNVEGGERCTQGGLLERNAIWFPEKKEKKKKSETGESKKHNEKILSRRDQIEEVL